MALRIGLRALLLGAILLAGGAAADDFDFEVGLTYDRTQLDSEQTFTSNVGTIFNATEVDTDAYGLFGSWYFAGLSDDNGPRARAAFVDRASMLSVGYVRTDVTFSTSIVSTDPLVPPFEGEFESDGDAYALDLRYVWRDSGWFMNAGVAEADANVGGTIGGSSDATAWRLGVGKYLFDTTTLALDVSETDDDVADATVVALAFAHLGDMGETWQYGVDLGYARTDGDFDLEIDSWNAALSLYPNRDVEFGLRIVEQDADPEFLESTSYEGFASWFVTPSVVLGASYRVDDVDSRGSVAFQPADRDSDTDQDGFSLSVSVRF
ncbi:MAG: hypothetical protein QNJ23_05675 [Woeseiaceae bacterium]|nr:hypothetical protein [Woeseiaceae bacterium]